MEILMEWIRLVTGAVVQLELEDGVLNIYKLTREVQDAIEIFTFGMDRLMPQDLEHIDSQWNSLDDLRYLHRLYMSIYQNSENKVKPITDIWNPLKGLVYVCENHGSRLFLKYLMLPQEVTNNNIKLETLNRNFENYVNEIENLPILMGFREGTTPTEPTVLIINRENINGIRAEGKIGGTYIGDCMLFREEVVLSIGGKLTYWDEINGTRVFDKTNVKALSEILCKSGIHRTQAGSYRTLLENIR